MRVFRLPDSTIVVLLTNPMIVMRQAINGVLSRRKGDGYGWCHEGEHSNRRHRYRDAETEALGKGDQHAVEPRSTVPETSVVGGRV